MRTLYLSLMGLVLVGILIGTMIALNKKDVGHLAFRDQKFASAQKAFEQAIKSGDTSSDTVISALRSALHAGDLEKAQLYIDEGEKLFPQNKEYLSLAILYYRTTQQYEKLNALLQSNALLTPRERLNIYRDFHDKAGEKNQLTELKKTESLTANELTRLALLQAQDKDYADSFDTLEYLAKKYPNNFAWYHTHLLASTSILIKGEKSIDYLKRSIARIHWFYTTSKLLGTSTIDDLLSIIALHSPDAARIVLASDQEKKITVSNYLLTRIAFTALNTWHEKSLAEELFLHIGKDSSPQSPEVKALLFLWGPRPTSEQQRWIVQRFEQAPPDERIHWIEIMAHMTTLPVIDQVLQKSVSGFSRDEASIYNKMLVANNRGEDFHSSLSKLKLSSLDGKTLKEIAQNALALSLYDDAYNAFHQIVLKNAQDKEAQLQLGILAFQLNRFTEAENVLLQSLHIESCLKEKKAEKDKNDYLLGYYYVGQLFERQLKKREAKIAYGCALSSFNMNQDKVRESRFLKADIFAKTGNFNGVITTLNPFRETLTVRERALLGDAFRQTGNLTQAREILFPKEQSG